MSRPRGGLIGFNASPSFDSNANDWVASGVWTIQEAESLRRASLWGLSDGLYLNVSVLLRMEGTNGSTTFIDSSPSPQTITANGNAQISTAQSKFGESSGLFDGSGDYLSIPSVTLTGPFTVECFVRWISRKNYALLCAGTNANTQLFFGLKSDQSGLRWGLTGLFEYGNANFTWSNNQWYHVALVRNASNVFKAFVDGVDVTNGSPSSNQSFSGVLEVAGSGGEGFEPNAYIDNFRVTTVARYSQNFTPPRHTF